MVSSILLLCLVSLVAPSGPGRRPTSSHRKGGSVRTASEAKVIAEKATGGIAVSARQIPLNGATGGWEVEIHMPRDDRGWRCIVDSDSHSVFRRERIPNPDGKKRRR